MTHEKFGSTSQVIDFCARLVANLVIFKREVREYVQWVCFYWQQQYFHSTISICLYYLSWVPGALTEFKDDIVFFNPLIFMQCGAWDPPRRFSYFFMFLHSLGVVHTSMNQDTIIEKYLMSLFGKKITFLENVMNTQHDICIRNMMLHMQQI